MTLDTQRAMQNSPQLDQFETQNTPADERQTWRWSQRILPVGKVKQDLQALYNLAKNQPDKLARILKIDELLQKGKNKVSDIITRY